MSIARDPPHRTFRRGREGGYTFVEITLSLAIISLMTFLAERTITSTHEAERLLQATRIVTQRGQLVAYEVFDSVSASRKLYQRNAVGQGYLSALDLSRAPLAPLSRLPLIDETRELGPDDVGDPRTGNVLLFVEEGDPIACIADPTTVKVRHIDAYRFVCAYPSETTRTVVPEDGPARDMVVWRSDLFPSLPQLIAIEDVTERAAVVADLANRHGHGHAWDPNADVDNAFFPIDALGTIAGAPALNHTIAEDIVVSNRGRLVYANVQLSRTDSQFYRRRAVFTAAETPAWLPDGFEVKIAGASGSRKVWLRLVVSSPASKGQVAFHPSTMIASVRDL